MKGIVIRNRKLNDKYYYMAINSEEFVRKSFPGQFLMLQPREFDYFYDPLLRRPFGICDTDPIKNEFSILYMIVGKGTSLLSTIKEGSTLDFSPPIGNRFTLLSNKKVAIVGGGIGIAPLFFLAKELKRQGCKTTMFFGGQSAEDIVFTDEFNLYTDKLIITTNNGSIGEKGLVTEPFEKDINNFDFIYTCGPKKMLEAVSKLCIKYNKPVEVSLDERMACGLGACLGCIVYVKEGDNEVQKRCCVEGPIFDGTKIIWESVCR
jgi:dihydroorotate dehydrogenase electron transfer subunit